MVTRPGSEEDLGIHASNFGGLNTTAAPLNATTSDALALLNLDTSVSGTLPKRRGTERLFETNQSFSHFLHNFRSNYGLEFLITVYNRTLRLSWIDDGTEWSIALFPNVFRFQDPDLTFVSVAEDNFRVLMFSQIECPKQLVLYEYSETVVTASANFLMQRPEIFVNQAVCDEVMVFVNGRLDPVATVTYGVVLVTVAPTAPVVIGDRVVLVYPGWNWWAEAELWKLANFRYTLPRFGESEADKLIITPAEILVDGLTAEPYGTYLYWSYINRLTLNQYSRVAFPTTALEYAWSNGTYPLRIDTNIDTATTGFATPVFSAFGQESNYVAYDQLELIHFNGNRIYIPGHEFRDGDFVDLVQTTDTLTQVTASYYVTVISANFIRLFTDVARTNAAVFTFENVSEVILAANVLPANDFVTHNGTQTVEWTGTAKVLPNGGSTLAGGFTFDRNYFIAVGSPTTRLIFYLDVGLKHVLDITSAADIFVYTTRRIILRKRQYNTVTFVRARAVTFNNSTVIIGTSLDVVVNDTALALNTSVATSTVGYALLNDPNNLATAVTTTTSGARFITLVAAGTAESDVILANKNPLWVGSAGNNNRFQIAVEASHRGGYFPAYGYGYYADYNRGSFNSCGAVHQSRLVLSGFPDHPGTVVASGFGDFYRKGENYNYFQINDSLEGLDYEPFDVVLQDSSTINRVVSWQQLLFVFSHSMVYRSINGNAPLSPANRAFVILSNQGCISKHGVAVAGNNIFYIAQSGLYSVPVVFENEYRSSEVTMKIRELFEKQSFQGVHYHKAREKLFMYSKTQTYVYDLLSESWTKYYSYVQFNHVSMSDVHDFTRGWTVASGVFNFIMQGVITWYSERYLDYALYVPNSASLVSFVKVPFEEIVANAQQSEYRLNTTFTELINTVDYEIWYGANRASSTRLTHGTNWIKISNSHFRVLSAPTTGFIYYVIPIPRGTWYGWGMYVDNIPLYLRANTFGNLAFNVAANSYGTGLNDLCLRLTTTPTDTINGVLSIAIASLDNCAFVALASNAWVGLCYPTEFMSIAFAREILGAYKRTEQVYTWFTARKERFDVTDYNQFSSFSSFLTYSYKYPTAVTVAIMHNLSSEAAVEFDLLSENSDNSTDEWVLFKTSLQRLGYVYRLYVTSTNIYSWNLAAYQILAKVMSGSGFISGGE